MAIACAYCGGQHSTPADVRACWQRNQASGTPLADPAVADVGLQEFAGEFDGGAFAGFDRGDDAFAGFDDQAATMARPAAPRAAPAAASGVASGVSSRAAPVRHSFAGAGPGALARGLVVLAGGIVPPAWAAAERVVIDSNVLADPAPTVAVLQARAAAGERVTIELVGSATSFGEPTRSTESTAPYALGPRFWFPLDVLHHLVWSNAIDATGAEPNWRALDDAVHVGAVPLAPHEQHLGDIRLPDGRNAWIDGGPVRRRAMVDGAVVLHAVAIEHGSLVPPLDDTPTGVIALAPDQAAAVTHLGAAARIIAPAGSGKTRVLTERARHLLNQWRIPPSALSLVAFNKRAQLEIQERTSDLRGLRVRTLNAIALAIVNGQAPFRPQPRTWRTVDEVEVRRIIGRLRTFPRKRNTDPVAAWIEALSMVRLGLRPPAQVETMYGGDVDGLAELWPKYRDELDRQGAVDFDDQIYRAIEVLLTDPEARATAQRACRMLLVDEFQDLTPAHVLLVRLLSAPGFGVFGVGDDDQTIYGYSGANPAWLIDFESLFPGAGDHPLEVNYRCPGDVVAAADRLVRHNRRRVPKVIRSARPDTTGLSVVSDPETLTSTLDTVIDAVAAGRAPGDIAVLARVNALLAPVQVGLAAAGIAVHGGVGAEFLERTAVRSAMAWMRLAVAGPESLAGTDLAEALRRPSRPMHPNVADWVAEQGSLAGLRRLAGRINTERDAARVAGFADDISRLQRMAVTGTSAELLHSLSDEVGLGAAIATLDDGRHGMNRAAQNDDLVALTQLAGLHPEVAGFGNWLRGHLTSSGAGARSESGVVLATVHRVKGQEWPLVVVHHAEADQYPHRLAEDFEEERRVFHVAITRGSERVVVVVGDDPSPFVTDMVTEPVAGATTRPGESQRRADPPPAKSARAAGQKAPARPTAFDKAVVLAAPGLVIVDGGQEWTIEAVEELAAVARHGGVTRRFSFGSAVVTAGRQRGPLRAAAEGGPSAASIRAHDLLRQARERLRAGKPAYVVFDDKTLEAIATALPTTQRALGGISGIGPAKLEQYGDAILLAVEDATSDNTAQPAAGET
ncbi:MAG: putative ATP-dependent helicase [Ilumatobacteraceae bacterium]|nr:putative ATP-dependent helicase [Ilumatobacteraceae bacterium]